MKTTFPLKKIIVIILILGVGYGVYARFFKKATPSNLVTIKTQVKRGDLENAIKVIGSSKLVDEQKMKFNQVGKVAKINFKEGDKVKKGQILAELDKEDVLNTIKQAEVSLNDAKIRLAQTIKGAEQKDILKSKGDVANAENNLRAAADNLENLLTERDNKLSDAANQISTKESDIANKTIDLANAKQDLDNLIAQEGKNISDFGTDTNKTISTAYTDARKYTLDAKKMLRDIDMIFGVSDENDTNNDSFEMYLSAKNSTYKSQTVNQWQTANTLLVKSEQIYTTLDESHLTKENILPLISSLADTYESLMLLSKNASDAIQASVTSSTFSQSQLDTYYNQMISNASSAQSGYNSCQTTITNINKLTPEDLKNSQSQLTITQKKASISSAESSLISLRNDLTSLKKSLELTKSTYKTKIEQQQFDITNLTNALAISKESLRVLLRGATTEDIALAKNSIAKQALSLENSKKALDKYELEAPFDGVLRKIDFKVGDNITSDEQKYIYIENPNLIQITVTVDQLDVVKLRVGQDAKIIFDSYPNVTFDGKVSEINSTPLETSGVTSYEITVTMDKGNHDIFSGMTAKVNIIVEKKKDVLYVPASFIQKRRGRAIVLKEDLSDPTGSGITTPIEIGMSNLLNTEILSGVTAGETIIRKVSTSTGSTTSGGLFPGMGGGGNRQGGTGNSGGQAARDAGFH